MGAQVHCERYNQEIRSKNFIISALVNIFKLLFKQSRVAVNKEILGPRQQRIVYLITYSRVDFSKVCRF